MTPDAALDASGFETADAAVRHLGTPRACHYLARALALRRLGFLSTARDDLRRALRLGSSDADVLDAVMRWHDDPALRITAARAAMSDQHMGDATLGLAVDILVGAGFDPLVYANRTGSTVAGWVAGQDAAPPRLTGYAIDGSTMPVCVEDRFSAVGGQGSKQWLFHVDETSGRLGSLRARSSAGATDVAMPAAAVQQRPRRMAGEHVSLPVARGLTIVVPVYGDPESLSACLASIERQDQADLSIVIVDDASPDMDVSRRALAFCRGRRRLYLRNPANRGFAGSVNAALARSRRTDVLLLNSDVILPDRALDRLRLAVHRAPDIGIVAPLSNDAGNASFPDPLAPGSVLPFADALRVDAAADSINRGITVDLPSVHGSCLLIRRECLDRTGPLSLVYGRGYYEDTDLCSRARECGFRVVAACDVYVSHDSGRSFGADRSPLVTRNRAVFERRFPGHAAEDAAHDAADPLRRLRGAIEEAMPMLPGAAVVIVGRMATRGALVRERARRARRDGTPTLVLDWSTGQDGLLCRLESEDERGPRSLDFPIDPPGLQRLSDYLRRSTIDRIEVCETDAIPLLLQDWLATAAGLAPVTVVVDGVPTAAGRPPARPGAIVATDAMARALAFGTISDQAGSTRKTAKDGHEVRPGSGRDIPSGQHVGPLRLAVLLPQPCFEADRLIIAVARRLHREPAARLLVLGASAITARLAAPGSCWVSGPMHLSEVRQALVHHGVDRLWLPYRGSHHWVLEAVDDRRHPSVYFDASPSGLPVGVGDLALDPAEAEATSCSRIMAWLAGPTEQNPA